MSPVLLDEETWLLAQRGEGSPPPKGWLGIDVGFMYPAVDSDGQIYQWTRGRNRPRTTYTQAGPVTIRRADGSTRRFEPYDEQAFAVVMARAQGQEFRGRVRGTALSIVAKAEHSQRGLALEDWSDSLHRRAPWMELYRALLRRADDRDVPIRLVQAAWTSQTCPECGHRAKGNRPRRDWFCCQKCGFEGQADRVAARNIHNRAEAHRAVTKEGAQSRCRNAACRSLKVWRASLCCSCYFSQYRRGRLPNITELAALQAARNYAEFKRSLDVMAQVTTQTERALIHKRQVDFATKSRAEAALFRERQDRAWEANEVLVRRARGR